MKAAVTTDWNRMQVQDLPTPEPAAGQVRIRLLYAGVCGSDVHIFHGHHPTARRPIVQDHEFVGVLDAVGPDTEAPAAIGQRVVVEPLVSCGRCEACRRGHVHVCRNLGLLGIHVNGGFAEYLLAPAHKAIAVPPSLDDRVAALAEPFAVAVHVCRRAELLVGERALVIGAGPIGLIIAAVAEFAGARVVLSEINPQRIEQAREMGFEVIDAATDPASAARHLSGGDGFDVVFEVSGAPPAVLFATEAARVRGRIVQVGLFGPRTPPANLSQLVYKELSIIGSRVYTFEDFVHTVALLDQMVQQQRFDPTRLITGICGLEDIASTIEDIAAGRSKGKVLVDLRGR